MAPRALPLLLLAFASLVAAEPAAPVPATLRSGDPAPGEGLDYLLYLPDGYARDTARRWPMVVFLHGMGERGVEAAQLRRVGLPRAVERRGNLAYILVAPVCPAGQFWQTKPLNRLLDRVLADNRADPARVVLTGLSMGGMGTWRWGMDAPSRFSALVPVCGGVAPSGVDALRDMPIWAFHGDADPVVSIDGHRRIVEAAKAAGARVRFTVYPGVGHNCWDRAYGDPSLEEWMLLQRRR